MANEVRWRLVLDSKDFTGGIAAAEKQFEGFLKQLSGGAGALGNVAAAMGPVGVAAAAAMGAATVAVGAFAKATLDGAVAAVSFAGNLSDLSTKTGISGVALQGLGAAGQLVGVTMEEAATAVMKMQQHMVKAPEDFKQLGLSVENLQKLAPEKQFEAVGKAIQAIQDPAQRTAATIAFFGKSGQEAMKLLSVDIGAAGEQALRLGNIMSDSTRAALDALGDSATVLGTTWEHLWMNIGGAIAETPAVRRALEAVTDALGGLSRFVQLNGKEIQELVELAVEPMGRALVDLLHGVQFMVSAFLQWKSAINDVKNGLRGGWLEAAVNAMGGGLGDEKRPDATGWVTVAPPRPQPGGHPPGWVDPAALKKQLAEEAAAWEKARKAAQALQDALSKQGSIIIERGQQFAVVRREIDTVTVSVDDFTAALLRMEEGNPLERFASRAIQNGARLADIFQSVESIFDTLGVSADSTLRRIVEGMADVAAGAKDIFAGLATNNPAQVIGGIAHSLPALRDAAGELRSFLGIEHGIFSGHIFTAAERLSHEIMVMQTEFINASGGLNVLEAAAAEAGVSLDEMWNARTVEEYEAAVGRVNAAIALHEEAIDKTKEAMERWGLSAEQMGPRFASGLLHEQLASIFQDFELLTHAIDGATVTAETAARVLGDPSDPKSMAAAMNALVQQSIAAGVALPEAMRPMIERMIELGLLVDGTGAQLTDVSQLSFTETLEAGVQRLILKIEDLVNALLGIPPEVETWVKVNYQTNGAPPPGAPQVTPPPDGPPPEGFALGGRVEASPGGRLIRVGEGGEGESIVPDSQAGDFASDIIGGAGGGGGSSSSGGGLQDLVSGVAAAVAAATAAQRDVNLTVQTTNNFADSALVATAESKGRLADLVNSEMPRLVRSQARIIKEIVRQELRTQGVI